ncbi:MAG: RadC family protein [Anaerolineae bacterium]
MSETSYRALIKEMPANDRPRERLAFHGPASLHDSELIAITLRTGTRAENAVALAQRLLQKFQGLGGLAAAGYGDLCQVPGIGPAKAAEIMAAMELGRRAVMCNETRAKVSSPADVANLLMSRMHGKTQEEMHVLILDTKNQVIRIEVVYRGTVNAAMIRPSEVFREAVRQNAKSIIVAHNHPSGDPTPSPEDKQINESLIEVGKLLDIEMLDHLVIGANCWISLREKHLGFRE